MNVPKLRFKEFNDEWITYKFYDLVSIINGQVDPNKKEYCNLPHIGPGNIEKETGRLLEYNLAKDDKLISSKYLFNEKSVIYGKINPHFAKVCYPKFVGLCSADAYPINPIEEKLTSTFLLYLLLNPKFTKFATSVSMRTGMPKINRDELGIYKFTIPKINEQIKIGKTLELLDKKIELQSKKIEDLKLFKKGLLIKEFNNKKCSNKLKECFDFGKAGGTPKSTNKDYYNGYIPFLSISDMTTQGKYIYYTDKSITEDGLNNSTAWLVPKNSIIISMYASYGLVSINKIDLTTSQAMFNMIINKNYVVEYIYYYLYYLYISNFYNSIVSTGTQSNLNAEQIKLLDIYIPCYKEQKRIYEQFSKIDFKINLEQKKINELLYLKKGLMQNMFV